MDRGPAVRSRSTHGLSIWDDFTLTVVRKALPVAPRKRDHRTRGFLLYRSILSLSKLRHLKHHDYTLFCFREVRRRCSSFAASSTALLGPWINAIIRSRAESAEHQHPGLGAFDTRSCVAAGADADD